MLRPIATFHINMFERAAISTLAIKINQAPRQGLPGKYLQLGLKRRSDRIAALAQGFLAIHRHQVAAYFFGKSFSRKQLRPKWSGTHIQRFCLGVFQFCGTDVVVFKHLVQNPVAAINGLLGMAKRMIIVRPFRQGRKIGHFVQRQFIE